MQLLQSNLVTHNPNLQRFSFCPNLRASLFPTGAGIRATACSKLQANFLCLLYFLVDFDHALLRGPHLRASGAGKGQKRNAEHSWADSSCERPVPGGRAGTHWLHRRQGFKVSCAVHPVLFFLCSHSLFQLRSRNLKNKKTKTKNTKPRVQSVLGMPTSLLERLQHAYKSVVHAQCLGNSFKQQKHCANSSPVDNYACCCRRGSPTGTTADGAADLQIKWHWHYQVMAIFL